MNALDTRQPGRPGRLLFWLIITGVTLMVIKSDWLWRLDQLLYDAHLQFWGRPAPADIIIIAIDDESLGKIGRWPWSRAIHASLLDILTTEQARAVAMDIIFAEPASDAGQADRKLAQALSRNNTTVLPVVVEQSRSAGQLIETLPITLLANAARKLGHVHVELDQDGIARSVYLKAGLGAPHWPNLGLALLQLANPQTAAIDMGERSPGINSGSPLVWTRDNKMLIAYAGPPGHFQRISYSQVLEGHFAPGTFTDKLVLIGATAAGLGDALPTPVSGHTHSMPGVEINANIIDTIRHGIDIRITPVLTQMLVTVAIILIPALMFAQLTPRFNLILTVSLLVLIILGSFLLLRLAHIWYPPSAILLSLILSYPLWNWRRLEYAMRYLDQEISRLHVEQSKMASDEDIDMHSTMRFLSELLPIQGWSLFDKTGSLLVSQGQAPQRTSATDIPAGSWLLQDNVYWLDISAEPGLGLLGLTWEAGSKPDQAQQALLNELLQRYQSRHRSEPGNTVELVQARIRQVQQASDRLQALRQFILDVISQMSDGVLVVEPMGAIVLSNDRAHEYLTNGMQSNLQHTLLTDALSSLHIQGGRSWASLLREVLLRHRNIQIDAQHQNGRDLLVQIVPLDRSKRELGGLIVNLSDISALKSSERRRSELLGFLSHDLRSPLVSLIALIEIARLKDPDHEQLSQLDRMEAYANKTINLAEEFLQLAYAESGENIQFKETDLISVSYNAIEHVWAQAEKKGIQLKQTVAADEAWIHAEAGLLERALVNLLNNAIKYSPENTLVNLTIDRHDDHYHCCVQDQGQGISEQNINRLFDRFYRVPQDQQQTQEKGAGLGLAFVQAVAQRHNGRVTVRSSPGEGSVFCLILPCPEQ